MKPQVAVVTDSLSCLTREQVEQYGIQIIPINFYAGGRLYKDWVDITPSEAYKLFLQDPQSFRTSAASPEDCLKALREAGKQARNILCITVSAKLSAVYDIAWGVKKRLENELTGTSVEVLDSQTVTAAEGFVVLGAALAAAEGKDLAAVVRAVEEVKSKVTFVAVLDTIRHVYRTGRIPKIAAMAGARLNIKPILTSSSGLVRFIGAVRSRERGVERLLQIMRDRVGERPVHVAVMHAYAPDEAQKLMERVSSEFNCAELWLTEFSPIMGYATGTGTLGLAFYPGD